MLNFVLEMISEGGCIGLWRQAQAPFSKKRERAKEEAWGEIDDSALLMMVSDGRFHGCYACGWTSCFIVEADL